MSENALKKPASITCDSFGFIAYEAAITIENNSDKTVCNSHPLNIAGSS